MMITKNWALRHYAEKSYQYIRYGLKRHLIALFVSLWVGWTLIMFWDASFNSAEKNYTVVYNACPDKGKEVTVRLERTITGATSQLVFYCGK